ncbi:hypothetical protein TrVE_jg3421 [Triparma verrucosa]|uniref:Uncharacterized protein n=1 Tax=Triparma verrucosa TaxID=1606542 RepID=A0A9W7C574_9STRA|nr:hypothetical protein TrVE_jg3421 [Triparma verrucosa]
MILLSKGSLTASISENVSDEENPTETVTSPVYEPEEEEKVNSVETMEIEMTTMTDRCEEPMISKKTVNEDVQVEAATDDRKKKPPMIKNPSVKIRVSVTSLAKKFSKNSDN